MLRYVLKRLAWSVPTLFFICFLSFMVFQLSPGNYFDQLKMNPDVSEKTIQDFMERYHFDRHALIQFGYWLKGVIGLDFGYSLSQSNVKVFAILWHRLGNTMILSFSAMLFAWLLAIPLGILCAVYHRKFWDRFLTTNSFIGLSIPNFFLALLLLFAAARSGILPIGGMHSIGYKEWPWHLQLWDLLRHLVIPVVVIGTSQMAGLVRLIRANVLDVFKENFVDMARARGLKERTVFFRHVLPNAFNPMISLLGFEFSALFSGAALTEILCDWPGLGSILLEATRSQDVFLVMGNIVMVGFLLIVGNLIADILLAKLDPRIRLLNSSG